MRLKKKNECFTASEGVFPIKILKTFILGLLGGCLFYVLHLPLAWVLGPALPIMLMNVFRPEEVKWPSPIFRTGIVVLAYVIGRTITKELAGRMLTELPWMVLSAFVWIAISVVLAFMLSKWARLELSTAMLGCVPGGMSQMVLIAQDMNRGDAGLIAILQASRVLVVLYTVPFLATVFAQNHEGEMVSNMMQMSSPTSPQLWGYIALPLVVLAAWIARRTRFSGGDFLFVFLTVGALSIAGIHWPEVPDLLLTVVQLGMGIFIGSIVQPRTTFANKRLAPIALLSAFILVSFSAAAAWILSMVTHESVASWFLAIVPGGLNEMVLVSLGLNEDVIKVAAYQIIRLMIILFIAPSILKLILKRIKYNHQESMGS